MAKSKKEAKRGFGQILRSSSGRWRARYTGPDSKLHNALSTFEDRDAAVIWLAAERALCETPHTWTSPAVRAAERQEAKGTAPTLAEFAPNWVKNRKTRKGEPLAARTRDHYTDILDRHLLPVFGHMELRAITPEHVAHWYDTMAGIPTYRAHAYSLLKAIMATAADPSHNLRRGALIPFNPCTVKGGGSVDRVHRTELATAQQVAELASLVPERHRLMVLLADGCGLRFGELAELRRNTVDTEKGTIKVRQAVSRSKSAGVITKKPKSDAGIRDLYLPPHLVPEVERHLAEHVDPARDALLFPGRNGEHLAPSAFYGRAAVVTKSGVIRRKGWGWYEARRAIGRPDLRFHDLRHGALTEAARNGATLAELMELAGHSTSQAALRYQHSVSERQAELARKRSENLGWKAESTDA